MRTELAKLPVRRLTAHDFRRWYLDRHPTDLADATRKRGMSTMRAFLQFVVEAGWGDRDLLQACFAFHHLPPRREWLRPEQVRALAALVREPFFDPYEQFVYETLLATGIRSFELPPLRLDDFDPIDRVLRIRSGKGRGQGKPRQVPLDGRYITWFEAHAERYAIPAGGFVFFGRDGQQAKGASRGTYVRIDDHRRATTAKPVRQMLSRVTELARERLEPGLRPTFQITPKVLRRTYACLHTIKAELNRDGQGTALAMRSLQIAMGHQSLETTMLYMADVDEYLHGHRRYVGTLEAVDDILEWVREQGGDAA